MVSLHAILVSVVLKNQLEYVKVNFHVSDKRPHETTTLAIVQYVSHLALVIDIYV